MGVLYVVCTLCTDRYYSLFIVSIYSRHYRAVKKDSVMETELTLYFSLLNVILVLQWRYSSGDIYFSWYGVRGEVLR